MKVSFDTETKALLKKLKDLPLKMQDSAIKRGVRAGARTIQKEAKMNAPVDKGLLKSKITVKKAKGKYNGGFMVVVNVNAPHHHLIELGTKDRVPTKAKMLSFMGSGGNMVFAKKVKGVKADPFLGKAFESKREAVVAEFKKSIERFIKRQNI